MLSATRRIFHPFCSSTLTRSRAIHSVVQERNVNGKILANWRLLTAAHSSSSSSSAPPPPLTPVGSEKSQQQMQQQDPNHMAPKELTFDMMKCVLDTTMQYILHGLTHHRLMEISEKEKDELLVLRWQGMMEAFLAAQLHTLAGFGYSPTEAGLQRYNAQVAQLVQSSQLDSTQQEEMKVRGRDIWRLALSKAFSVPMEDIMAKAGGINVPEARDMMHKVASRMQDPNILEMIAQRTNSAAAEAAPGTELNAKHTAVQNILVNEVYLGGSPSLVEQCGFEASEKGYVMMQCVMTEHQTDPLVAQYIGSAMMRVLQSAGLDPASLGQQPK